MPRLRRKSLLKTNLELFLNNVLLTDGFYTNISAGESDFYNNDLSQLVMSDDPTFALDGMVWQSAFKEWVYEVITTTDTGVLPPAVVSGVTVDGTFYPQNSGSPGYSPSFSHSFDFRNGRIIFDSPISTTSVVQAEFAYKTVSVDFADEFESEDRPLLIETTLKDNPAQTGVEVYPSVEAKTLPLMLIEIDSRINEPYELGNQSQISEFRGSFHVWTRESYIKDLIEDLITERERDVILGIDFNIAPFPLTSIGDKNPDYTQYSDYAQIWSPEFWRRIYLDELELVRDAPLHNIERGRITFLARIYPNF